MNKVKVVHKADNTTDLILNGVPLRWVTDYSITKSSAEQFTELTVTLSCDEFSEILNTAK